MHVIIGEKLYDADYVARYTNGFEALRERVREYDPERVAALTGIAKEDIVELAREYATTRPAVIRLNYGVQRSEHGGAAVRADRGSSGAHRIVARSRRRTAAFHLAGFPVRPRRRSKCRSCSCARRSAAKRASSICPSSARR